MPQQWGLNGLVYFLTASGHSYNQPTLNATYQANKSLNRNHAMQESEPKPTASDSTPSQSWQQAVEAFPAEAHALLNTIWLHKGVLDHHTVGQLMRQIGCGLEELMMRLLPLAQQYAVVPVSHYKVGAVAAGTDLQANGSRSLYLGANFEFSNAALSSSIHAEQCAINNAWLNGQTGVAVLAVSAAPCGYCRQFINELAGAQNLTILLPKAFYTPSSRPFSSLLPDAFGPTDLGVDAGLMNPALGQHNLGINGAVASGVEASLAGAALAAAKASYAPYLTDDAHAYAGVALLLADGFILAGRHAVNAAHNPSLSPLQSALAFMNLNRPMTATKVVTRAALVEVHSKASQLGSTRLTLQAYAPNAQLDYYTATVL